MPLYPRQAEYLDSPAAFRGFVGGRGAGKTFVGAYDLLRRMRPGRLYAAAAPTYPMLRDATLRTFLGVAAAVGAAVDLNRSEMRATVRGAEVLFRSADDPERLRGPNLSGAWVDEASLTPAETFEILIACLREGGRQGWLGATFTPKGKTHWTHDVFATGRPDTRLVHARTGDNPFLPPGFEAIVRRQYTADFAAQELGGEFLEGYGTWFDRADLGPALPLAPVGTEAVRYWDTAASTGASACDTAGVLVGRVPDGRVAVLDVVAGKWSPVQRDAAILATCHADAKRPGVRVVGTWVEQEPGGSGVSDVQSIIRKCAGFPVYADKVTGDKDTRLRPFAAMWQSKNVVLVAGHWHAAFLDELERIPGGKKRDRSDAAGGAFNKLADPARAGSVALPSTAAAGESILDSRPEWGEY